MTKGKDLRVAFDIRVVYGDQTSDMPAGTTAAPPVMAPALIDGSRAVIAVKSAVADAIPSGKLWRVIVGMHGLHLVPVNGVTVRYDGKPVT